MHKKKPESSKSLKVFYNSIYNSQKSLIRQIETRNKLLAEIKTVESSEKSNKTKNDLSTINQNFNSYMKENVKEKVKNVKLGSILEEDKFNLDRLLNNYKSKGFQINFSSRKNIFKDSPVIMENKEILKFYKTSKLKHDKDLYYLKKLKNQANQKMSISNQNAYFRKGNIFKTPIKTNKNIESLKSDIRKNIKDNNQFKKFKDDFFKTNTKKLYSNRVINLSPSKFSVNNTNLSSHQNSSLYEDVHSFSNSHKNFNTLSYNRFDKSEIDSSEESRDKSLEKLYKNTVRTLKTKEISSNDEFNLYEYFRKFRSIEKNKIKIRLDKENLFNDINSEIKKNKNKFHTFNFNKLITPESNYGDKINLKKIKQIRNMNERIDNFDGFMIKLYMTSE